MEKSVNKTLVTIEKEKATFWMDGSGRWHNRHGVFSHKKIIDHFNSSIQKDGKGYYVTQELGHATEKVYFPYDVTALFVVDVIWGDKVKVVLNTKAELELIPKNLFINSDHLYCRLGGQIAKFTDRALLGISDMISHANGRYLFSMGEEAFALPELEIHL